MSAPVTRGHRERAVRLWFVSDPSELHPDTRRWIETGEDDEDEPEFANCAAVAQTLADYDATGFERGVREAIKACDALVRDAYQAQVNAEEEGDDDAKKEWWARGDSLRTVRSGLTALLTRTNGGKE